MKCICEKLVLFLSLIVLATVPPSKADPVPDLLYDDTKFMFFSHSPSIDWSAAQNNCQIWGGNLATISSQKEDRMLQLLTNVKDYFSCWIGLNDMYTEAGSDSSKFTWKDGSTSTYRNLVLFPSDQNNADCVAYRYEMSDGTISTGWKNLDCNQRANCSYCTKTDNSRGCDLIYNGKCYRAFEVSDGINWLDAQSSCAVWGGDLTSIDTERDIALLIQYIPDSVGECWIGLHDGYGDGTFQWVDGTSVTYYRWDTEEPGISTTNECVVLISAKSRHWKSISCDATKNSFLCEIDISNITTLAPVLTIRYSSLIGETFSSVYPAENSITVPLSTRDITLSIDIDGKWNLPDNSNSFNSELTIAIVSTTNAGLYKFYINNWDGEEQIAMQLMIYVTNPDITADNEIIFGNSTYGYITTYSTITWLTSQLNCNNWGGNLATIESKQIDSLLYYLTTVYSCWIGLNDRTTEAGTDASAFVWVDGSTSTYRQFATITNGGTEPTGGGNENCVDFRFASGVSSDGWDDLDCNANVNCYFCQKSGDSRGCDLIYEGSCYRAFEVSDGINWLDAQSSCAVWGGDLTSITTERENNLLYTAISDTVSNYWIGLYERDGDGMYQWVDGTVLSYTMWTGTAPTPDSTHDCVQMNTNGAGSWIATDCQATSNSFVCKKPSSSTVTTGSVFGELTDGGLNFRTIATDTFLYTSTILICKGDASSASIIWHYSINADLSSSVPQTATYMSTETGLSWLSVDNAKQGYYQCQIDSTNKYTVGVYNDGETTVASEGASYQYTVGIDREDIQLLCDPMNSSYKLDSFSWRVMSDTFANPINIFSSRNSFPETSTLIQCVSNSVTIRTNLIRVYVPQITVTYETSPTMNLSTVCPGMNTIALKIRSDVSISVNSMGRWKLPDDTYESSSTIRYSSLQFSQFGVYQFYDHNFDGAEVCVIQITINLGGYSDTNSITLSNSDTIQNGSTVVSTEDSTVINCVISNTSYSIEWFYTSQLGDAQTDITGDSTFSAGTGISTLTVYSNTTGYYSCVINTDIIFLFYLADRNTLVEIQNFDSPTQQVNYTAGDTSSVLYYSHASIPDISLRWTTDIVTDGADTQYSIEYPNPVLLSRVFSDVGGGVHTLSCFYRMSPVTLVGSIMLIIRDTATISISYGGYNDTFSDTNNLMFPSPQQISIPKGTRGVSFNCNQIKCKWMILDSTTSDSSSYIIPIFREEDEGNYSLLRAIGGTEREYSTAHVYVHLQQPSTSFLITIIAIIIIIIIIICVIATLIVALVYIVKKKMQSSERTMMFDKRKKHSSVTSRNSGYANIAELQSPKREYIELRNNPSGTEYMTIDGTSQNESEMEKHDPGKKTPHYTNLADLDSNENDYEMIKENKDHVVMKTAESSEKYPAMSAIKEEKKFVANSIPTKDFPATYQQYVASGMRSESLFAVEFSALNEESKKYVECSKEGRKHHNVSKNPIKNILPYDENRVVLESPYFECNYINASWLESFQFIASIHPTGNTLQDFLQMIYQTEASMVIMLSTRKEKAKILGGVSNRVCYWPQKDNPLICEPFETHLNSSSETTAFLRQEISLKHTLEGKSHSFIHCISPIWNEDGTVIDVNSVIILLNRVIKQKQDYPLKPIIIHCENGISETGVFLTVFDAIRELNLRKSINIFNAVKNLRKQRMSMVPTMACYTTCYSLMNEYCSINL